MPLIARGARPSPNIWTHPAVYEVENAAADPDGLIEQAIREVRDWAGGDVLDLGCGTGYHLPRFAATARSVVGVEPHGRLAALARRRVAALPGVAVRQGAAQDLPLPAASVDVAHARWAYFFGPGSEPGLRELARVVRRGGAAFVVDNDPTRSTFGRWFAAGYPDRDPAAVLRFWSCHGFARRPLLIRWRFARRSDFAAVVRIELPPAVADRALAEHRALEVDYAVNLFWRRYP